MSNHRLGLVVVAAFCLTSLCSSRVFGDFMLVARQSSLDYTNTIGGSTSSKTSSTDHFGVYHDSLSFDQSDAAGSSGSTLARQSTSAGLVNGSLLSGGTLSAQASAQFDVAGNDMLNLETESTHVVEFQVVGKTEPFHLSGDFGTQSSNGANALVKVFTVITHAGQKGIDWEIDNSQTAKFDTFGDLPPNTYKLVAMVNAGALNDGPGNTQEFGKSVAVQFNFEAGAAASAVPLPPAVYSGAVLLAVAFGLVGRRKLLLAR